MRTSKLVLLGSVFISLTAGAADLCKLGDIQKQNDADVAAEHTHLTDLALQDSDLKKQLVDFNEHRSYYDAIVGTYEGDEALESSDTKDAEKVITDVKRTVTAQIELSNDFMRLTNTPPSTAYEVNTQTAALSFNVTVNEVSRGLSESGQQVSMVITCVENNVKPDFVLGTMTVTCQNVAVGTGRTYNFSIGDTAMRPQLVAGKINQVNMMNVEVIAPFNSIKLLGQMTRKTSEKN